MNIMTLWGIWLVKTGALLIIGTIATGIILTPLIIYAQDINLIRRTR